MPCSQLCPGAEQVLRAPGFSEDAPAGVWSPGCHLRQSAREGDGVPEDCGGRGFPGVRASSLGPGCRCKAFRFFVAGPWAQAARGDAACSKVLRITQKSASHSLVLVKAQRRRASHPEPPLGVRSPQLGWQRRCPEYRAPLGEQS